MVTADPALPLWLFVSYGGGHVKALLPVAQRVQAMGIARPLYLALTTAAHSVRAAGVPMIGFRDLVQPGDERALEKGQELAGRLSVQAAEREESVAYLGLSYVDLEDRLGAAEAAEQFGRYGRQAFLPLGVLARVMDRFRPALVVATNSPRAEQAAIQVAGERGVPSTVLVDLLGIWERPLLAKPEYASALCVLNEGVRRSVVEAGRPAAQVHVTGNPAFDTLHDPQMKAQGQRHRQQLGWSDLHVCLYASSPEPVTIPGIAGTGDPAFPRRIEDALVALVQENPKLALWIRRHPSEEAGGAALQPHPRIRWSGGDMPLHACIHGSDEVIVTVSTVGVEASLAGKPVTQVRGSILDALSPYVAMGLAQRELTLDGLPLAYGVGAFTPLRPVAPAHEFTVTGSAADRVVHVLQSVAGRLA